MINLLSRIFIKNRTDYHNPQVRTAYGILCSVFGIFLNILLFAAKLIGAIVSNSVAILADAFNNLSDAGSSIVSVISFKMSGKKPDADHPFGHGRIEYISGLIVSFLILFMGIELFRSSIDSIIHPKKVEGGIFSMAIIFISIFVKFYMFIYNRSVAKKINSPVMEAVAKDSLGDVVSTGVVVLSVVLGKFTSLPLDGIGGLIVAVFIFKGGIESCKDTINPLLGRPPEKEFVEQIEETVLSFKPILAIHDLIVHDYGPGRLMISLHAEIPGDQNIFALHEVIDHAEYELGRKFGCQATIHMDPIDIDNPRLAQLKEIAAEESQHMDCRFTIHDVRMVPGEKHTNLIFDLVRPHDCQMSENEIREKLAAAINARQPDVYCVITIDSPFVT